MKCLFQIIEVRIMIFWSQRSVVLVAAVSAVILSSFITARSSYDGEKLGGQKYYIEQDGNYYTNPRQDVGIPFARPPSLLGKVINAIKRLMRFPDRIRRQGFGVALSGWAPVAIAGVATALVVRDDIADIVQDLVDPTTTTTTAATTTANPCAGVTCSGDGITPYANLGICQCLCGGKAYDHTANRCVSGVLKCGANAACSGVHGYCYKHDAKTTADSNAYTTSAITTSDTTGGMACVCSASAKSCTGTDANYCHTDGVCKCGTTGAACKSTDGTPYCVHHKNVKVNGVDTISTQASVQDNSGEPKCSCYVDTKSGQYVCGDTSLTACVIKSCLTAKPICCGDKSKNPGIKYSCKAASSECKK